MNDHDQSKRNDKENREPPKQTNLGRMPLLWLLLFFLFAYYLLDGMRQERAVALSYTEFKEEVRQDNIAEITVEGLEISGKFDGTYTEVSGQDTLSYEQFATVRPSIEDRELMTLLEEHGVRINAKEESSNAWWQIFLISMLPWLLILGYFVYASRRMQGQMKGMFGGGGLFNVGKSKAKRYRETENQMKFDDVAGLENAKRDLQEVIEYLKEPEKFTKLGADIPKGLLLVGPPGTGKTMLARATAGEADVAFYNISGSEFIEMFVGVGASRVRDMFSNAKKEAPSIIFIDEIDSIGRARGTGLGGGHDEREQTLNQILSEMDGFAPHESVVVMAATNRPDVLDPALTRPGRFDRQITLELPQKQAREKIFKIHIRKVPVASDVDIGTLAARTVGFSGADIKNLVNEAALLAGRKGKTEVDAECFDEARDKILLGHVREEMINDEEKKVIAHHEAGHALLARLLPGTDPVKKVTIIPRGRSLGVTEQMPEEDRHNLDRTYLLNRIAITLGGRAAEKLVYNDITNGAANDLKQVTRIARRMVCQWGMSEKLGAVSYNQGEDHMFLGREIAQSRDFSDETARLIDEEVQRIVGEMEEKAQKLLQENRSRLDSLAQALLEQETLDDEEIELILKQDKEKPNGQGQQAKAINLDPA